MSPTGSPWPLRAPSSQDGIRKADPLLHLSFLALGCFCPQTGVLVTASSDMGAAGLTCHPQTPFPQIAGPNSYSLRSKRGSQRRARQTAVQVSQKHSEVLCLVYARRCFAGHNCAKQANFEVPCGKVSRRTNERLGFQFADTGNYEGSPSSWAFCEGVPR